MNRSIITNKKINGRPVRQNVANANRKKIQSAPLGNSATTIETTIGTKTIKKATTKWFQRMSIWLIQILTRQANAKLTSMMMVKIPIRTTSPGWLSSKKQFGNLGRFSRLGKGEGLRLEA